MDDDFQSQFDKAINDYATKNQYGVSKVPYHVHTGVDSPQIDYKNLVNKGTIPTAGAGLIDTSGVFSVDTGTTEGKIVQLDGSAKLPAVDGSQLTGLTTNQIQSFTAGENIAVGEAVCLGLYNTANPITRDVSTTASTNNTNTPITQSITIANHTNRELLVFVVIDQNCGDPSSITYNGASLTKLATQQSPNDVIGSVWHLRNPDIGTYNVVINFYYPGYVAAVAIMSYYNVAAIGNANSGMTPGNATMSLTTYNPVYLGTVFVAAA